MHKPVKILPGFSYRYAECKQKLGDNDAAIEAYNEMAGRYPASPLAVQANWNVKNLMWINNYGSKVLLNREKSFEIASRM